MSRISYQGALGDGAGPGREGAYVRLGPRAIGTRRKDAGTRLKATISKSQSRWLDDVVALTGGNVDADAVVRALIDLGMELDIDWPLIARGRMLRGAVRESVMVHRRTPR